MAKKKNFKQAGKVLSQSEVQSIAKAKDITPTEVISRAIDQGIGIGSKVVANYNTPGGLGTFVYSGTPDNLRPLQNLSIPKGTAYFGSSTTSTPASRDMNSGYTAGSTTYNPIVLPRNTATGTGTGGGNNTGDGTGNQDDPYQELRDQIAQAQQTITDLQNQQVDPYPELTDLLAQQQAQAAAQQEAMAAQAAQQQQALQDLMIQQQQAYETQMADARRQQEAMAAQAAEAQRQAMAVQNARVPGLEPTATAPALGDARNATRNSATNTLSNLAILTGLGTSAGVTATPATATPLAGLQIA